MQEVGQRTDRCAGGRAGQSPVKDKSCQLFQSTELN
jgi:hypothetical protein